MSHLSICVQAIVPTAKRLTVLTTALSLIFATCGYTPAGAQPQPQQQPQEPMQGAPQLAPAQLDQLVAPIALYPDNLLGQVLSASTYPLELVMAARWSSTNPNVTGQQLEAAMQSQAWDPSVKALTAVPQVLKMLNEKLEWTQQLGEAYLSQPDDIAASVQRLRARADASGNLKNSEQVRVKRVVAERPVAAIGPEYIVIEPVVPDTIFVPIYDPYRVYGVWPYPDYRPFYWYPPGYVSVGLIGFGAAVFVGTAIWATYNWNAGRVYVNPFMYSSFNRVTVTQANALAMAPLRHDPAHRGPLGYKNPALQTQFNKTVNVNTQTNITRTTNTTNSGTGQNVIKNSGTGQNVLRNTGTINTNSGSPKGRSAVTNTSNTTVNNNNNVTINKNTTNRNVNIGNTLGNTSGNGPKNVNIGNTSGNGPRNVTTNSNARNVTTNSNLNNRPLNLGSNPTVRSNPVPKGGNAGGNKKGPH